MALNFQSTIFGMVCQNGIVHVQHSYDLPGDLFQLV